MILKLIKNVFESDRGNYEVPEANTKTHKDCPDCDGTGYDINKGSFDDCENCKGTGIGRKTYKEYVESLSD